MQYQVGSTGKVIAMKLEDGEDIYQCIEGTAHKEGIQAASVLITGGCRKASVVVGPKSESPKILGDFREFTGPGEIFGVGTLYPDEEGPKLHIHTGIGKGDNAIVGCARGGATAFLTLEVTIIELSGIDGERKLDESKGFKLLTFE